jgi:DNA recombination protein RmuC
METNAIWIAVVLAAAAGFGLALFWNRARPTADEKRVAELEAQLAAAREAGMRASVQAAELEREATTLREQLLETAQRAAIFEERALLLGDAKQALENAFKSLSAEALKSNNAAFLDLARASLAEFQQGARGDLEKRQMAIDALMGPVKASLEKVDEKIGALERAREQAYGEIRQQFAQIADTQNQLRLETSNLVKALRQPHVRGRWGEVQLRRVVEMAGMLKHVDFREQESAEGEEGTLRPDLIVHLPGNRQIIVDSKAPIAAYLEAHEAASDEERKVKIAQHAQLMRGHMQALGAKRYWEQFQPTPEVVVMFIPGEAFFSAALEADPELLDIGFGQNVIIASPASLMALLKAAAYGWRQESIAENARAISQLGQDLHARLGVMADHLLRLGKSLGNATDAYNSAIASFETRVLVSARKFKELGATSQEAEIIELRPVEAGVRRLPCGMAFDSIACPRSPAHDNRARNSHNNDEETRHEPRHVGTFVPVSRDIGGGRFGQRHQRLVLDAHHHAARDRGPHQRRPRQPLHAGTRGGRPALPGVAHRPRQSHAHRGRQRARAQSHHGLLAERPRFRARWAALRDPEQQRHLPFHAERHRHASDGHRVRDQRAGQQRPRIRLERQPLDR